MEQILTLDVGTTSVKACLFDRNLRMEPDGPEFKALLEAREPGVLNRVINLETGSLAVEAALKMMLSRFYTLSGAKAPYEDRIPVFLVMADNDGGVTAGYHGTTILAQTLRGLWPWLAERAKDAWRVEPVAINDAASFRAAIEKWNRPPYKTAGFCHELVMLCSQQSGACRPIILTSVGATLARPYEPSLMT